MMQLAVGIRATIQGMGLPAAIAALQAARGNLTAAQPQLAAAQNAMDSYAATYGSSGGMSAGGWAALAAGVRAAGGAVGSAAAQIPANLSAFSQASAAKHSASCPARRSLPPLLLKLPVSASTLPLNLRPLLPPTPASSRPPLLPCPGLGTSGAAARCACRRGLPAQRSGRHAGPAGRHDPGCVPLPGQPGRHAGHIRRPAPAAPQTGSRCPGCHQRHRGLDAAGGREN